MYHYYQALQHKAKGGQILLFLILLLANTGVTTATAALGVLQFQPVILTYSFELAQSMNFLAISSLRTAVAILILGLLNFIPQLWCGFDIVTLMANSISKSNPIRRNPISQFCGRKLYLIFHFANILRFIKANASISLSSREEKNNTVTFILISIAQICYIFAIIQEYGVSFLVLYEF